MLACRGRSETYAYLGARSDTKVRATLGGMAPPLTFKTGVPNPIDYWQGYRVSKNSRFSTAYGLKVSCATSSN